MDSKFQILTESRVLKKVSTKRPNEIQHLDYKHKKAKIEYESSHSVITERISKSIQWHYLVKKCCLPLFYASTNSITLLNKKEITEL